MRDLIYTGQRRIAYLGTVLTTGDSIPVDDDEADAMGLRPDFDDPDRPQGAPTNPEGDNNG